MIVTGRDPDFLQQLDVTAAALHERGLVNENALLAVFKGLAAGTPLTVDALAEVFGVETIYHLMATPGDQADRARVRQQLDDIRDRLVTANHEDEWHEVVQANLQLVELLRHEFGMRPRWWATAQR